MKKRKLAGILAGALLAASLFAACGSADRNSGAVPDDGYSSGAYAALESAEEADWDTAEEADWDAAEDTLASGDAAEDGGSGEYKNLDKIVYSCSVDMQTLEYDNSVSELREAISAAGGIVQSETESDNDYSWYYDESSRSVNNRTLYLTVRIPSDKYEAFVAALDRYGKVMNKTQNADNISKTYNDTSTYISSLETEQKRLLEMMDKAETIEDMMAVEERLTEVQRQLNQHKTDLEAMDMDLAYSTVTLNLQEVQKITSEPERTDSFGTRVRKAFRNAWSGFAAFWEDFLFALIYLLPAILVIGAIVWVILFATRGKRRARKERKAAERAMYEDLKRRAGQELQQTAEGKRKNDE